MMSDSIETTMSKHRDRLPVRMISRDNVSLWSVLKNCIGKELTKIAMPIVFNEPLSFLQRVTEGGEYLKLLEAANNSPDPIERMELVCAFAVGGLSNNADRMNKPFNPLLGETYEFAQDDTGYRIVCEQVSHHPPISAYHGESDHFILRGSVHPKLKFWGKSVEVKPDGYVNVELRKHMEVYTWRNVNCCVHNIIVGKLWFEQYGVMEIRNHSLDIKAVINFKSSGWFGRDLNRVDGFIFKDNRKVRFLYGKWTSYLKSASMDDYEEYIKENNFKVPDTPEDALSSCVNTLTKQLTATSLESSTDSSDNSITPKPESLVGDIPKSDSSNSLDIPNSRLIWTVTPRPLHAKDYYNFTSLAMTLNELDPQLKKTLPPTDCRLRPDIRLYEEGDLDRAAAEKNRLEEKQREVRKMRRKNRSSFEPLWFTLAINPHTKEEDWLFNGKYWKRDFSLCPDIY